MTEENARPEETAQFETDTVQADRAREQGLGLGERELNAQRDPGGVSTANEEPEFEDGVSARAEDEQAPTDSLGAQESEQPEQAPQPSSQP